MVRYSGSRYRGFYKNGGKNCVTRFGGHGIRGSGMGGAFTVYRRLIVL